MKATHPRRARHATLASRRPASTYPAPNEVLVRVRASSVNPVDNAIAAGMLKEMVEHEFPITLGRDYAGVVEQVGAEVTGFSVGDDVFGFLGARTRPCTPAAGPN